MKSRYQQLFFRRAYFSEFYNPKRTWLGIYLRPWFFQETWNRRMPKKIKFRVVKIFVKPPVLSRNLTSLGPFLLKITVTIHLSVAHVWSQFFEYIAQKFREINFVKISNSTSSFNFHTSSDNLFVDKTQRQLILRARHCLYRCQACRYQAPEQASGLRTRARKIDAFQQISWSIFESTWKSVKNVENFVKSSD